MLIIPLRLRLFMPEWQIDIKIKKQFKRHLNRPYLRRIIRGVLAAEEAPSPLEVSLVITDDEDVHRLNKRYGKNDHTTDVLAFPLNEEKTTASHGSNPGPTFISPQDGVPLLGEVIISYPQALRQVEEHKNSIEEEVTLLIIHGFLHLLGYDHASQADRKRMQGHEKKIILGLTDNGKR